MTDYNENSERQRMLNILSKSGFRVDDTNAQLAWRICTQTMDNEYQQENLFAEVANLVKKVRNEIRNY